MREGTRTALLEKEWFDEGCVKRALAATEEVASEHKVRTGLEAVVELAETDPAAARSALHRLRGDHRRLAQLEGWLGGEPKRATFAVGAAIQIADAELAEPVPDFDRLVPELLHWLEGNW